MIAEQIEAWADRLETIALPTNVVVAEARDLAVIARQAEDQQKDTLSQACASREQEIAQRDERIAELEAALEAQRPALPTE